MRMLEAQVSIVDLFLGLGVCLALILGERLVNAHRANIVSLGILSLAAGGVAHEIWAVAAVMCAAS